MAQHCHLPVSSSTAAQVPGYALWGASPLPTPFTAKARRVNLERHRGWAESPEDTELPPPHAPVYTLGRWGCWVGHQVKGWAGDGNFSLQWPWFSPLCPLH